MPGIPSGRRAYTRVIVEHRTSTPIDGDGGYTEDWTVGVPPDWYVAIDAPGAVATERVQGESVVTQPAMTVTGPFRADIKTTSRLVTGDGRYLSIASVTPTEGRPFELVCACLELATP
jgi:hypothetical protein